MSKGKILKTPTLHYVEEVAGATNPGVTELPLEQIDLSNTQFEYRLDPGLELLIDSIRKDGQQIPVIVRGIAPPYQLVCGFRRTRSIKAIGGQMVKAIILPEIDDEKAHRLSVLENEERKSLTDLDRANACKRLQDEGKTQEEIAAIMGCSQPKISRYFSLLSLPAPVFEALKAGRINTVHALLLKDSGDLFSAEYLTKLIEEIEQKSLSSRELERKIKGAKKDKSGHPKERPYFQRTKQGFKLIGFSYRPDLPLDEKQKAVQALKEALALLEAGLKGGMGK
ncbi:MAG: ParB/RepB/Spo0J family partition protein [Firmicutes bacterium]|nr:ParB/RepB/Spo0J family partition protein [Bacillota bacterium]